MITIKVYKHHSQKKKDICPLQVRNLRTTTHEEYDRWGKLKTNRYVEFIVVGKNRQWPDFMTIADFKKLNPKVNL